MLTFGIPHHIFIGRDFFPVRDDDSDIIDNAGLQDSQVNSPCCDERRLSSSILQDQDEQDCMCYVDVVFFSSCRLLIFLLFLHYSFLYFVVCIPSVFSVFPDVLLYFCLF